jgi:hypothetical protein
MVLHSEEYLPTLSQVSIDSQRTTIIARANVTLRLFLSLGNKSDILPLQQNPSQLSPIVLLRMYLYRIINHQVHKLVKSLPLALYRIVRRSTASKWAYSNFSFNAIVDLFKQPYLNCDMLLKEFEDKILHISTAEKNEEYTMGGTITFRAFPDMMVMRRSFEDSAQAKIPSDQALDRHTNKRWLNSEAPIRSKSAAEQALCNRKIRADSSGRRHKDRINFRRHTNLLHHLTDHQVPTQLDRKPIPFHKEQTQDYTDPRDQRIGCYCTT